MAKDRYGYGTYQKGGEAGGRSKEELREVLLSLFPDEKFRGQLGEWLDAKPKQGGYPEGSYADMRHIMKRIFPESGLLMVGNKKTDDYKAVATYTGPADEEGRKRFETFQTILGMMSDVKGIPIPSISVTSELGEVYGNTDAKAYAEGMQQKEV